MKKWFAIIFFFLIINILACKEPIRLNYYSTGELFEKFSFSNKNDTTNYSYTAFYKNGNKKSRGNVVNGEKVGKWTEWYADGKVKWSGDYSSRHDIYRKTYNYNFLLEHDELKINQPTRCRVSIDSVYPAFIGMFASNGTIKRLFYDDMYDFVVTPYKKGEERIKILLYLKNTNEIITVAEFKYDVK